MPQSCLSKAKNGRKNEHQSNRRWQVIALIQRVRNARVDIDGQCTGAIGQGLLALVAIERGDSAAQREKLLQKILHYRVFSDALGKMNLSLKDVSGGLLLVSQFTLAADTNSGLRPSFSAAAAPDQALLGFNALVELARAAHPTVATGVFGADMQVSLTNDGPVTFWLQAR
jgi:D-aminoacyl-tRNA deacylase